MATYFEREYTRRPREWASCFRVGTRTNTNMFVESFHRTLKEVYFERKQNRLDHLLFKLRKISRDKAYEQWIKAEKGKATVRQREKMKRHKQAELVPTGALWKKDTHSWEVQSCKEKRKVYCVRRITSTVCTCLLRCSSCMTCVHSFDCTFLNYSVTERCPVYPHTCRLPEWPYPLVRGMWRRRQGPRYRDYWGKTTGLSEFSSHQQRAEKLHGTRRP